MLKRKSIIHSHVDGKNVGSIKAFDTNEWQALPRIGIDLSKLVGTANDSKFGMDALQPTVTQGSVGTPIQFLQNWLPGFVFVATAARKIDELIGITTLGSWEDNEIVQGILERTGTALPYDDYTNVPLSSWNTNFVYRSVVRFEEGMKVGVLESAQASRMRVDDEGMKREAALLNLEIARNIVGFFGFNSGNNNTYGFLNDPGLPSYTTLPNGASGSPLWSTKTYLEIIKDIRTAVAQLRTQSQDTIDPETVDLTLALPTSVVDYLSTATDFGYTVRQWMKDNYPRMRPVSAPQLNAANGGANVFYLYADSVNDLSTDDGKTFIQVVPMKFQVLGVQQLAKGYEEDYSNATAGVMVKRPYAVTRYSGC